MRIEGQSNLLDRNGVKGRQERTKMANSIGGPRERHPPIGVGSKFGGEREN